MRQIQAFISAACATLETEREFIKLLCDELKIGAYLPQDKSLNYLNSYEYLEQLQNATIAIFLTTGEPTSSLLKELEIASQAGIPAIILEKLTSAESSFYKHPTIKPSLVEFYKTFYNIGELKSNLYLILAELLEKKIHAYVGLQEGHEAAYQQALELIQIARQRVIVVQKTSSVILGPRKSRPSEAAFYDGVIAFCNQCKKNRKLELIHLFSLDATRTELQTGHIDSYTDPLNRLAQVRGIIRPNVLLAYTNQSVSSLIICDDSFGIGFDLGVKLFSFALYQTKTANQFAQRINQLINQEGSRDFKTIQTELLT